MAAMSGRPTPSGLYPEAARDVGPDPLVTTDLQRAVLRVRVPLPHGDGGGHAGRPIPWPAMSQTRPGFGKGSVGRGPLAGEQRGDAEHGETGKGAGQGQKGLYLVRGQCLHPGDGREGAAFQR
ncbi:hypothetical protein SAMN00790413_03173 [Deinococcus hopiensis KR-140]|uniref:Uncharacterized protein n=1 Tax=Deinococcus hopiensis KR-140 TaxID=695939 RepID=A0A1W1VTE2_9DEIO|nr:hypothetical protein SAMN00790413_03173 [Deinococcus hopiensis KR-140]